MLKKYPIIKWSLITIAGLLLLLFSFGLWFKSLIPPLDKQLPNTEVADLDYVTKNILSQRGKILAVVTSTDTMGDTGKYTGYELSELARAYYVFVANGFEVDIASPQGGEAPVVIDDEDMGAYDFAFLNDTIAQNKTRNTIPIEQIVPEEYEAVFFVGGKGAMFDFPDNPHIQGLLRNYHQEGKTIGAVCHGPAALVNVTLDNGEALLKNKTVSSFTNEEELLLIPDAATVFPFLLQDKITAQGAQFNAGEMYLEKMSHDKNIITGQNPWSVWAVAETMIKQMGYVPKKRILTDEENAVKVLNSYHQQGSESAKAILKKMVKEEQLAVNRVLIAKHGIIAAMQAEIGQFYDLIRLVSFAKKMDV